MKRLIALSLVVFSIFTTQAQTYSIHLHRQINMPGILSTDRGLSSASSFASVSEARTIITDIMTTVNIPQNFKVVATTQVPNAAALTYGGQRYILYNPYFISSIDRAAGYDKWASISILAHEIGHHLLGHTMDGKGSLPERELAADQFSGYVLHKMGATLEEAQHAMKLFGNDEASETHPASRDRLVAIANGWAQVKDNTSNTASGNTVYEPTVSTRRNTYPASNVSVSAPAEEVTHSITFMRGFTGRYFITSKNNVIVYNNNRAYAVAKISRTNSSSFPYMIYDDHVQLYIDGAGNIYNGKGRRIGVINSNS
jgi:hypothetical protein